MLNLSISTQTQKSQSTLLTSTSTEQLLNQSTVYSADDSAESSSTEPAAKLGWILIQKRWISAAQLQMLLSQQSRIAYQHPQKLGELLLEQSLITQTQLETALKEQYWRRNGYWVI